MYFALYELYHTLADALAEAWAAMDLRRRLSAWWWCCIHRHLLDGPAPEGSADG
jgi:hypothetical protein